MRHQNGWGRRQSAMYVTIESRGRVARRGKGKLEMTIAKHFRESQGLKSQGLMMQGALIVGYRCDARRPAVAISDLNDGLRGIC